MPNSVLIGAQWGDEGKGKIIDVLTEDVDIVVRYQGGGNAGHTVEVGDERYILHLVPSGILREDTHCVIGNGVVVDPLTLSEEIRELEKRGFSLGGRLHVSDRAHVVFPYHRELDTGRENTSDENSKIGTTKRGIGPTYGDKASRRGIRMGDLLDENALDEMIIERVDENNRVLATMGAQPVEAAEVVTSYREVAQFLAPYISDTVSLLHDAHAHGKSILFEGAQGTMLDIDFGTFPYVTSSNATSGGACTGTGIAPNAIDRVIGVVKAYTTRVGAGPFPTELFDEAGETLSREGKEFGATTGRPRRCGWFDAVVARYSAMVNGVDLWAITKLDVLDSFESIKICVAYDCDGERLERIPANIRQFARCRPIYEEMEGWCTSTREATGYDDLPAAARLYLERLCELSGGELGIVSVGPRRASTLRIAL
jgi:adenylosuccinate synthase